MDSLLQLCGAVSKRVVYERAYPRAAAFAAEHRDFYSVLLKKVAEEMRHRPQRVLCLGGLGLSAAAAARCHAEAEIVSLHVSANEPLAEKTRDLVEMICTANRASQVVVVSQVPEGPLFDLLVVEELDPFVVTEGLLAGLKAATPRLPAQPRVIPSKARVMGRLCAMKDFCSVAKGFYGGFRLEESITSALRRTLPALQIDDDNSLLDGCHFLSEPFAVLELWGGTQDVVTMPEEQIQELRVTATEAGCCSALLYWWETEGPTAASPKKASCWLQEPLPLKPGQCVLAAVERKPGGLRFQLRRDTSDPGSELQRLRLEPNLVVLRHAPMLRDDGRNEAYGRAIERGILEARQRFGRADVFEIGSGTGLLLMMARRAGAETVTGCELDPAVCATAAQALTENAMASDCSPIMLRCQGFQELIGSKQLEQKFNVLVAELMDDSGMGEFIWPFFTLARQHLLLRPPNGPPLPTIPKRLTIFAQLVFAQLSPVEGLELWPLDPFWLSSAVPKLDSLGSHGPLALDLDALEEHWEAASELMEVLRVDLERTGQDPQHLPQPQNIEVNFRALRSGPVNGVIWFWRADLDTETALTTAPLQYQGFIAGGQPHVIRGSRFCWKQAAQGLGPIWVQKDQVVVATLSHDSVAIRWALPEGNPEVDIMPLFGWLETEGLTPEMVVRARQLVKNHFESKPMHAEDLMKLKASCEALTPEAREELLHKLLELPLHPAGQNYMVQLLFGSRTSGAFR